MEKQIENILSQVAEIVRQDKEQKDCSVDNFNMFDILKLQSDEKKHSAFLAELLNPKGRHGLGDTFLRAFVESVDCLKSWEFDICNAQVDTEHDIGPINKKYTQGGKIDILIKSQSKAIIIENKIYADDQPKQLIRYKNFAEKTFESEDNYRLIYLTLSGDEASYKSVKEQLEVDNDYYAIGYSSEILEWLKVCESQSSQNIMVVSAITQYIKTIKDLINQNMLPENSDKIIEIMSRPENIEAVLFIQNKNNIGEWVSRIIEKYLIPQLQKLARDNNLQFHYEENLLYGQKHAGCYFYKKEWERSVIWIDADKKGWRDFYIGISSKDGKSLKGYTNKYQIFENPDIWWPYGWKYLDEYRTWYIETMIDIVEGKVAEYIIERVKEVLDKISEMGIKMP